MCGLGGGYKECIDNLISSLSWITLHGFQDDKLSFEKKYSKSLHGKLIMSCGYASSWASRILNQVGVRSRIVLGLTLEKWNSYDNGHTMLEVYIDELKKWILYDIDNNVMFSIGSNYLNIWELYCAISRGLEYQMISLASAALYAPSKYLLYHEKILSGQLNLRKWYNKVLQIPLIQDDDSNYYFCNNENRARIEAYSQKYLFMEEDAFKEHFYSKQI